MYKESSSFIWMTGMFVQQTYTLAGKKYFLLLFVVLVSKFLRPASVVVLLCLGKRLWWNVSLILVLFWQVWDSTVVTLWQAFRCSQWKNKRLKDLKADCNFCGGWHKCMWVSSIYLVLVWVGVSNFRVRKPQEEPLHQWHLWRSPYDYISTRGLDSLMKVPRFKGLVGVCWNNKNLKILLEITWTIDKKYYYWSAGKQTAFVSFSPNETIHFIRKNSYLVKHLGFFV